MVGKLAQYVILNDIHFPYEGQAYYKALKIAKKLPNLKHIFLNGDVAEIESVSSHPKGPTAQRSLLAEIDYVNSKFDQLQRMFKDIPVTMIEGNHCYRVFRYIRDVAPEMWGMLNMPTLFKFEDRPNWLWVPYGPTQWHKCAAANLWLRHEPLGGGQTHAKITAEKSSVNVIYGHTHQFQQYTAKKQGPNPYNVTATSGGWLGDITKSCFDYRGSKDNWQSGFTIIECDEQTGEYELRFQYL